MVSRPSRDKVETSACVSLGSCACNSAGQPPLPAAAPGGKGITAQSTMVLLHYWYTRGYSGRDGAAVTGSHWKIFPSPGDWPPAYAWTALACWLGVSTRQRRSSVRQRAGKAAHLPIHACASGFFSVFFFCSISRILIPYAVLRLRGQERGHS